MLWSPCDSCANAQQRRETHKRAHPGAVQQWRSKRHRQMSRLERRPKRWRLRPPRVDEEFEKCIRQAIAKRMQNGGKPPSVPDRKHALDDEQLSPEEVPARLQELQQELDELNARKMQKFFALKRVLAADERKRQAMVAAQQRQVAATQHSMMQREAGMPPRPDPEGEPPLKMMRTDSASGSRAATPATSPGLGARRGVSPYNPGGMRSWQRASGPPPPPPPLPHAALDLSMQAASPALGLHRYPEPGGAGASYHQQQHQHQQPQHHHHGGEVNGTMRRSPPLPPPIAEPAVPPRQGRGGYHSGGDVPAGAQRHAAHTRPGYQGAGSSERGGNGTTRRW